MPGRLEFEHEVDNEAEIPVKDMEFGLVYKYGGDQQPAAQPAEVKPADDEEEAEPEAEAEAEDQVEVKQEEEDEDEKPLAKAGGKKKGKEKGKAKEKEEEDEAEEPPAEQVVEDEDELEVKLALLEIYFSKLDKREEAKDLIFDRCLTEYKKVSNTHDAG